MSCFFVFNRSVYILKKLYLKNGWLLNISEFSLADTRTYFKNVLS